MVDSTNEVNLMDNRFNDLNIGDKVKFDRDVRFDEAEIMEGETGTIIEWDGEKNNNGKDCAIKLNESHPDLEDLNNSFPLKTYNRQTQEDKEAKPMILDFIIKEK